MEPKLMSYITAKYSSKSDMMLSEREWQEVIDKILPASRKPGRCARWSRRSGIRKAASS